MNYRAIHLRDGRVICVGPDCQGRLHGDFGFDWTSAALVGMGTNLEHDSALMPIAMMIGAGVSGLAGAGIAWLGVKGLQLLYKKVKNSDTLTGEALRRPL